MNDKIFVLIEHLSGQVAGISYMMLAAAGQVAQQEGSEVQALLLGHQAQELANDLAAQRVLYFDHPALADFTPEPYLYVLADLIQREAPRLVLFGDTSIGAELAGRLSARLGLPLVSACRELARHNGQTGYVSQICGGKIMAEGILPGPTVLVTMIPGPYRPEGGRAARPPELSLQPVPDLGEMRVRLRQYIQPEAGDVDITKEDILISIGRGVGNQDNISLVEELAEALGGVVCASRPVVDQGWLPTTRLVGKSGKSVSSKIYLALGISGAPEHVEALTGCECIIAINTDPGAPIFNLARYGAVIDLLDLLPELSEQIQHSRAVHAV